MYVSIFGASPQKSSFLSVTNPMPAVKFHDLERAGPDPLIRFRQVGHPDLDEAVEKPGENLGQSEYQREGVRTREHSPNTTDGCGVLVLVLRQEVVLEDFNRPLRVPRFPIVELDVWPQIEWCTPAHQR